MRGLMAPILCADVKRLGLVVTRSFAMQCRVFRIIFFRVSEGLISSCSSLIKAVRTPCWIIVPRTDWTLAIRFRAMITCSRVLSLAPFNNWISARGTFPLVILTTRAMHCSSLSSFSSGSVSSVSFCSCVFCIFWISSYCSIVISLPSNASFRSVNGVAAMSWKIEAIPYAVTLSPAVRLSATFTKSSKPVCVDWSVALSPLAISSFTIVLVIR
mmetsp:Transcript_42729/g.103068  ORF Transcript_42729/g.103068 Transcript_42729/m.103068 type:complete len:214 (-) Transcript_42729:2175-2816(-)